MKINFGSGKQVLDGWTNIDAVVNPKAPRPPEIIHALEFDLNGNLVEQVPLPSECADELLASHVIEHFYVWQTPAVVGEWRRLLKQGGSLILELPNLEAAAKNVLADMDDQMTMWPLYGDPGHRDPYMCHRWAFTPKTIVALLTGCGFCRVKVKPPQTHRARANRDMRVEAVKA